MTSLCPPDILRPLRDDEIVKMIEICAKDLPMSTRGYNGLRMHVKLSQMCSENPVEYDKLVISDFMRRAIYTKHDGNLENCTFISISGVQNYTVFMYSNNEDELRDCLMKTNLIDYTQFPFFISVEGRHRTMLTEVLAARNIKITVENFSEVRILPKADALKYEYEIPDDVVEEKLCLNDAHIINEMWPHRYPGSLEFLKTLIGVNDSVGIYSRDTRKLRAWVILNDQFGLGMLQTLPEHRGKGYAKIVIKSLSKKIAAKYDLDIQIFILKGNTIAKDTFKKLGFEPIPMPDDYSWLYTKPL